MADAGNRDHLRWLRQVAHDADVTAFAVRIAVALTQYFNRGTGEAFMSQETLAGDLSASVDGVRKAVCQLEDHGHLAVSRGMGRSVVNRYRPVLKTPTASGVKRRENPDGQPGFQAAKTPTASGENPDSRPQKTPTARPLEPLEENPLEEPPESSARVVELFPELQPPAPKRRAKRSLPEIWAPPDDAYEFGASLGLTAADVELETAKFRDHAKATGRQLNDWTAGWRNWLRKAVEFRANGRGGGQRGGHRMSAVDYILEGELDEH